MQYLNKPVAAICLAVASAFVQAQEATYNFNIPAQSASQVINALSKQTGLQPFFTEDSVKGVQSPGVKGKYSLREALNKALVGTGLTYQFTAEKAVAIKAAPAEEVAQLSTIEVKSDVSRSLQAPSNAQAKRELGRVAGGTGFVDGEVVKEGVAASSADLLAFVPGLQTQEPNAYLNGATRIMMRGSAINSGASPIRGVKVLQDGIPITMASGFTDTESIDPWIIDRVEVYKGANAIQWGASNLGGAINMVTPTGYTAAPFRARLTLGPDNVRLVNLSGGGVLENGLDVYAALTSLEGDGFRDRTKEKMLKGFLSVGYRWNPSNETRLFLDVQDNQFINASSMRKSEIEANYKQNFASPNDPWSGYPVTRIALKHTALLNERDKLDISAYYNERNYNFTYAGFRDFRDDWKDLGVNVRHEINGKLNGMDNRFIWGALLQKKKVRDREFPLAADGVTRGTQDFEESDRYKNYELFFENQLGIANNLIMSLGGQWGYRQTESTRYLPWPPLPAQAVITSPHASNSWSQFNPKVGLLWQASKNQQVFGNISRSWEPPRRGDLIQFFNSPQLTDQSAVTYEIGTRGSIGATNYDLSFYHARVSDEILIMETPPRSQKYAMANVPKSIHQGIELGMDTVVPLRWFSEHDRMRIRGTYTWNDFKFKNDRTFGNSRLAGIPEHLARVEFQYQHPSTFTFGVNLDVTSKMYSDFANTNSAAGRTLLGATTSYSPTRQVRLFLQGRNLTDERYVAFVSPQANVGGADTRIYQPGAPRSIFAGIDFTY